MKTLKEKVVELLCEKSFYDLALGWLRYEVVRNLDARRFDAMCTLNLKGGVALNDLVDELIMEDK
jgi:hypothetical protein